MAGSIMGNLFKISTWGESHGRSLGVIIDGCPAGLSICEADIQKDLDRRKPGQSKFSTPRKEADTIEILSGVFNGVTTGTPISLIINNLNQKSKDYSKIANYYRPGHADYTYDAKYGFRDYRGGGRSSGRETAARVAAGAVAKKILSELGIKIMAYTLSIGNISIDKSKLDINEAYNNSLVMPDKTSYEKATALIEAVMKQEDSIGGIVECIITGLKAGVGEPVFEKLDATLAKAIFSIGAVKGVEFGSGFNSSSLLGSENNDQYRYENGLIEKSSNNSGGILGGISDGSEIVIKAAFKPTPSIHKTQKTVDSLNNNIEIQINGRHDPIIVPRAVVVVEAMTAITLVDYIFQGLLSKMDTIKKLF